MKRYKILLVSPSPPPYGGIAAYVQSLLGSALRNRYDLILFNTSIPANIRSPQIIPGRTYMGLFRLGLLKTLLLVSHVLYSFVKYIRILAKESPQLVHIHTCSFWGFWRNAAYLLIAKLLGYKTIFHIHTAIDKFYLEESGWLGKFLIRKTLNLADINIALSERLKGFVSGITHKRVIDVWNGVDIRVFNNSPNFKDAFNLSRNIKTILTVAPLCRNKGTFDILKCMPLVIKDDADVLFLFVGRGEVNRFINICREQGTERYTRFTGVISEEEKIKLYLSSHIFILPSYAEGQPLSILEAMAAGLPIVSTAIGSIPEVIKERDNGFLINPGDYKMLAEKIALLIKDDELREKIGRNNFNVAREKYDIDRVFREVGKVYDPLIK